MIVRKRSWCISFVVGLVMAFTAGLAPPATAQEDLTPEQYEALSHALGMTVEEIRALGLSPDELQVLLEGFMEETVVVGSRAQPRTVAASPVPVDVLSTSDLTSQGVVNLQDQLRTVIPAFNVNMQPISDASTVVRPAMLRNLAPDHTLVLVNGKRRHRSSIIDWHGGNGVAYGSQGPDISAIPAIALRQVEVLRDGAAAQYGSDAIAGVMNFQLKDAASGGSLVFDTGTFQAGDGEAFNVAGNVGLPLGRDRLRQPQPGVRQLQPDQPQRPAQRRHRPDRRRQRARRLGHAADLGLAGGRRRPEAVRQLRLHLRRRRAVVRPHELRQQARDRRLLLPQPEHARRRVQPRRRQHAAGGRPVVGRDRNGGRRQLSDRADHRQRA